jgi:hypothetical protein
MNKRNCKNEHSSILHQDVGAKTLVCSFIRIRALGTPADKIFVALFSVDQCAKATSMEGSRPAATDFHAFLSNVQYQ